MTKINQVSVCPACEAELPNPKPDSCPSCRYRLTPHETENYGTPDYVYSQYRSHLDRAKNEPGIVDKTGKLNREVLEFIVNMAETDKVDAAMDAALIFDTVAISTMTSLQLKRLVKIGISIGEKAKAIDAFIKAGGKTNGILSTTKPAPSIEDDDELGGERD